MDIKKTETFEIRKGVMPQSTWIHVCPSWIAGPRTAHPKFGGGVVIGGITLVEDRLRAIKNCFPNDFSSGHVFHEVACDDPDYVRLNSPNAVSFKRLVEGMEAGEFPLWSAMTSPAFGWRGCENGVILSNDPAIAAVGDYGHRTAINWSQTLFDRGLGKNNNILWPAFDSTLHRGPLAKMPRPEAREKMKWFLVELLHETGGNMWIEYKPSVPGWLDLFPTMKSAIAFCDEVNAELGYKALFIILEWAHALIGGQDVDEATEMQVAAGYFKRLVHANSADKATVFWNTDGTEILEGTPGDDSDWAVGEGGEDRWYDQERAVEILDNLGVEITVEHDIDPAGEDPMECYARSRTNLEQMIANVRLEKAA